jgi:hypothetical protein
MDRSRRALVALVVAAFVIAPAAALAAAPSNDNLSAAIAIPAAGGTASSTNVDASAEAGEPDHANSSFGALHSVWFEWTAPADGATTLDTCASGFNTRLGVYTGSAVNALTEVASNDNASSSTCGQPLFAALTFNAIAGTTYRIAVDTMGGVPDDVSGSPQGSVQLALDGPDVAPPADDGKTTPGTAVPGKVVRLRVPDLNPSGTAFTNALSIVPILEALKKDGLTYVLDADPYSSKEAETNAQRAYLRTKGVGGEIIRGQLSVESLDGSNSVPLKEGDLAEVNTAQSRLEFSVDFFHPEEDKKWIAQEKADLERNARDRLAAAEREREREEAKSKCLPIAAGESSKQIEARFPKANSPYTTFTDAIGVFSKLGCDLVIDRYVKGKPSAPHAYVKDVLRTDAKLKTVYLSLAQPGSHDFVFTIRENPAEFVSQATRASIPVGTDGRLTVSDKQLNRLTVQVIERASGRLVAGIPVTFIGKSGDYTSQLTNGDGETTFTSKLNHEGEFRLSAEFMDMEGYRTVNAVDRGDRAFTSMAGRKITRSKKDIYAGSNEAELDLAKSLPVVPANLGTGRVGEVSAVSVLQQASVTTVNASGQQFTGPHNTVALAENSQVLVGAAPGLLAVGGGSSQQAARPLARAGIPNPLEFLARIVAPLATAWDQGVANIRSALSPAQYTAIAGTASLIGQAGGNLISDKGLGVISTGGGNLIGQAGGNLISDKGLGVISVGGGNLIGQAGGNLISDKGLGVISTGGGNLIPVFGGKVISTGGLN